MAESIKFYVCLVDIFHSYIIKVSTLISCLCGLQAEILRRKVRICHFLSYVVLAIIMFVIAQPELERYVTYLNDFDR